MPPVRTGPSCMPASAPPATVIASSSRNSGLGTRPVDLTAAVSPISACASGAWSWIRRRRAGQLCVLNGLRTRNAPRLAPVLEVFGDQLGGTRPQGRLDDQRVPEVHRVLFGEVTRREDQQWIGVDPAPVDVLDDHIPRLGGGHRRSELASCDAVELLQDLGTDDADAVCPQVLQEVPRDSVLVRIVLVLRVEQDVGIDETDLGTRRAHGPFRSNRSSWSSARVQWRPPRSMASAIVRSAESRAFA